MRRFAIALLVAAAPVLHAQVSPQGSARAGLATAATVPAIPAELRDCDACPISQGAIRTALELKRAGWTYTMPRPKSAQARWGNHDRRTTWWPGYWKNVRTGATSETQPYKDERGEWVGDGRGVGYYRNGGSPSAPTQVEWLCSTSGGIRPLGAER